MAERSVRLRAHFDLKRLQALQAAQGAVLIVKLSSLGDVVHAMPVVHDLRTAFPGITVDWVVEPAFAPLVARVDGVRRVIPCALRRWRGAWWTAGVRAEWRLFRTALRAEHYDAVLDLQGLTKSALIARLAHGRSHGLANRTDGASHEPPARWLVHDAIRIAPRTHAVDRARELAGRALGYVPAGPPVFGLVASATQGSGQATPPQHGESPAANGVRTAGCVDPRSAPSTRSRSAGQTDAWAHDAPTVVFVHGTSRADKLWPDDHWLAFGRRCAAAGWHIALPQSCAAEAARAARWAAAWSADGVHVTVWPHGDLAHVVDRVAATQAVVGVDSGLSHIAVALDLPHVQIYNLPTAWRTGPQRGTADAAGPRQLAVEAEPAPSVAAVWAAWQAVTA